MLARVVALVFACVASTSAQDAVSFGDDLRPLIKRSCLRCHSTARHKGGIDLERAHTDSDVRGDPETWSRVVAQLEARFMPPEKGPSLKDPDRRTLVHGLRRVLAGDGRPRGGAPTLRRLNRHEYVRTVKDLLGVQVAARMFPEEARAHGFDNIGDTLFVSPLLLERYARVTEDVLDELFADDSVRKALLGPRPPESPEQSEEVLRSLMDRGFRRPATEEEVRGRVALVRRTHKAGASVSAAVRSGVKSVLLSPHFLFRVELPPDGHPEDRSWALDDWELAVRLSYFLWSTMPDARLFSLAREGKLGEDSVLKGEVSRMLDDPRSRALADRFAASWLGFGAVRDKGVEVWRFKKNAFHTLRNALYEEAARSFHDLVREDLSILRLLDCDETWLNGGLARHYGIEGVSGGELRRVKLKDRRRGGLLGMGAIHATTATALRTSPTVRGRWVLDTLLGTPPPPPPPDAGTLPPDDKPGKDGLSLRQRLERHREDARCASCHARIDPLGYALENFDPTGQWRVTLHGQPVDATAALPDGTRLDGPAALKDWLMSRKDRFLRTFAERLMTYSIGRPPAPYDEAAIAGICDQVRDSGYRMRKLVTLVVMSFPFRNRGG